MNSLIESPTAPFCVTSSKPGAGTVPLGRSLLEIASRAAANLDDDERATTGSELGDYCLQRQRHANGARLSKVSCPQALKAWAAERLPTLGISYGFANRLDQETISKNVDPQAALRLVQLADDATLIAGFARSIESLKIDAAQHQDGMEFRFRFLGAVHSDRFAAVEDSSLNALLNEAWRDNSLKIRYIATPEKLEVQAIVLRRKVRLGFSPLF